MPHLSIALVEIGGSHAECLLSQMHAIKTKGHKITLICTEKIKTQNPIFKTYVDDFFIVNLSSSKSKTKKEIKKIWLHLKNSDINKVVFNTAQGNHVRTLCLYALLNKIEFIGIIHTTLKFKNSFTQKIINLKIKKYLLLSKYLLSTITPPKGISVDYFYPIRYPKSNKKIEKSSAIVAIIGGVENRRRDLTGFIDMLITIKDINVFFVFLGKTNQYDEEVIAFRQKLESHNLDKKVLSFNDFIHQEIFDAYLRNADLIIPLIHPNTPSASQYFKNQISGAMCISFGYKTPLLIHEGYMHIAEMNKASFYYNETTFSDVLVDSLENIKKKTDEMHATCYYNTETQEERYAKFVLPQQQDNQHKQ